MYEDAQTQAAKTATGILAQLFVTPSMKDKIPGMLTRIKTAYPGVVLIGASDWHVVASGKLYSEKTVLMLSFFEHSQITACSVPIAFGEEKEGGQKLRSFIKSVQHETPIKGCLSYMTSQKIDVDTVLDFMADPDFHFPVFGGSAAAPNFSFYDAFIVGQNGMIESGGLVVLFSGEELDILPVKVSGWQLVGHKMTVTKLGAESHILKEIDGEPAAEIYKKYLGINPASNFTEETIEFPMMFERDGVKSPGTALKLLPDGSLLMGRRLKEGEPVWLAYGNPETMLIEDRQQFENYTAFAPQGIMLFPCIARFSLLKEAAVQEILRFGSLANSAGIYSFGEYTGTGERPEFINCDLTMAAFREGPKPDYNPVNISLQKKDKMNRDTSVIFALIHMLNAISGDYEEVSEALDEAGKTDQLTGLLNRREMNRFLSDMNQSNARCGMIMLDIDHFKQINDRFGHVEGDYVLKKLADILTHTAAEGIVGRWGGEEFLIITKTSVYALAEDIRRAVESADFGLGEPVTISLGAALRREGEDSESLYHRTDDALYRAKNLGRNRVESAG